MLRHVKVVETRESHDFEGDLLVGGRRISTHDQALVGLIDRWDKEEVGGAQVTVFG